MLEENETGDIRKSGCVVDDIDSVVVVGSVLQQTRSS